MNSLKLFPFMEREQILSDINKAIVPGVYGILNNRLDSLPITDVSLMRISAPTRQAES